jgi:hypothetical protein
VNCALCGIVTCKLLLDITQSYYYAFAFLTPKTLNYDIFYLLYSHLYTDHDNHLLGLAMATAQLARPLLDSEPFSLKVSLCTLW